MTGNRTQVPRSAVEEKVVSFLRDVQGRRQDGFSPAKDPLNLLNQLRDWWQTEVGVEPADPAQDDLDLVPPPTTTTPNEPAVTPDFAPPEAGYDEIHRRFVEHGTRLTEENRVTTEILREIRGRPNSRQELVRVRAHADSMAGGRFVLANPLDHESELQLTGEWSQGEGPPIVVEPRHVSLAARGEIPIRFYVDLSGSGVSAGTRLDGAIVARSGESAEYQLFIEIDVYGAPHAE